MYVCTKHMFIQQFVNFRIIFVTWSVGLVVFDIYVFLFDLAEPCYDPCLGAD